VWKLRAITKKIREDAQYVYVKGVSNVTELLGNYKIGKRNLQTKNG
jgi:hypothetical protein